MKRLFTFFTLMLCMVVQSWAGDIYTITFNGANVQTLNGEAIDNYFSWNTAKHNFNAKFTCTYNDASYSKGLKMEGATKVSWQSAAVATVTVVQSTWSANTLKLDGVELDVASAYEDADNGYREYVVREIQPGDHSLTRGSGESGIFLIKVEYVGEVKTKLDTPTMEYDNETGKVSISIPENAAKVIYTTDGNIPSEETAETYDASQPMYFEDGTIVTAIAVSGAEKFINSDPVSIQVMLQSTVVADPVISSVFGTVAISCETAAADIEYSFDGENFVPYERAFTVSEDTTVYARASRSIGQPSGTSAARVMAIDANGATKRIWLTNDSFTTGDADNIYEGNFGSDAEGFILTLMNNEKAWSNGNSIIVNGEKMTSMKVSNGAQNVLEFPEGLQVKRITIYSYINAASEGARVCSWKEINGEEFNADVPLGAYNNLNDWQTNPDVRVFPISDDAQKFTFTNKGEQVCFILAVDVVPEDPFVISMGEEGWATFIAKQNLDFSNTAGLKAYTVTLNDDYTVGLTQVKTVAANTALVLKGEEGDYEVGYCLESSTAKGDLQGGKKVTFTEDDVDLYWFYGLTVVDGNAKFARLTTEAGGTINAKKGYLKIAVPTDEEEANAIREFLPMADDVVTAVKGVAAANVSADAIYNLAGQRVTKAQKGLFIQNGKKIIR